MADPVRAQKTVTHYSVSVVIPNYNGEKLLAKNLPAVIHVLRDSGLEHEIIVVDDASMDDSAGFIRNQFPQVTCIVHPVNQGFSSACNTGIFAASKDLVLLLNTDILLSPDYFEKQLAYFTAEDTFGVMGRIVGPEGRPQDVARYARWKGGKIKSSSFYYPKSGAAPYTIYLSGANALIDRLKLVRLGGFNTLLNPFYCEDFDLGLRAWQMGWMCYYENDVVCIHEESSTTRKYNSRQRIKAIHTRNRMLVHFMHLGGFRKVLWACQILVELLFSWMIGRMYIYKAVTQFLRRIPAARKSATDFRRMKSGQPAARSIAETIDLFRKAVEASKQA